MRRAKEAYRVHAFYRQLFPDLFRPEDTRRFVSGASCSSRGKSDQRPKVSEMQRGWESQPMEFEYDLKVEGKIPSELRGTLYRNGPGLLEGK